jgi:hypothetical protein
MRTFIVACGTLCALGSCSGGPTERWVYSEAALVLTWTSAAGVPASRASVDVLVFDQAGCDDQTFAVTESFQLDDRGELRTNLRSIPGGSFNACVSARLRAPTGSKLRDTLLVGRQVRFKTPAKDSVLDTVRIAVVQP